MDAHPPLIDFQALRNASDQLAEALMLWRAQAPDSVLKPHLRTAVIQSFEYTYELSMRMLRRVLVERSLVADLVQDLSFNDLLRLGADAGLVADPQAWRRWRAMRNTTSHAYDAAKAEEVASHMDTFSAEARLLLERMSGSIRSGE